MALGSISAAGGGGGGGNSTQDVLATVLTGYCQGPGEGDDDEGLSHLNSALIHVQRTKRLDEVVAALGPYLTSDDGKQRGRATTLLAELINRLSSLPLADAAVHHYVDFFCNRLADFPSLSGSLLALRALLQHHPTPARKEAGVIMRALLKEVHVPSMSQGVRQRAFEVVFELLGAGTGGAQDGDEDRLGNMATELVSGFLDWLEGEKDPRCLILCLRTLAALQRAYPEVCDEQAEALFDVTACYFPITFTPPPNDPYGIKPHMLSNALQDVLTGRPSLAEYVLPLLVDKLSSTHVPAKVEALKTIQAAARSFGPAAIRRNLPSLADALYQEKNSSGGDAAVTSLVLDTVVSLARLLSAHATTGGRAGQEDWTVFSRALLDKAVLEVKSNANSMVGRSCGQLLAAVARASARALSCVLSSSLPVLLSLLQDETHGDTEAQGGARQETVLEILLQVLDAVDPHMDFTSSRDGPPLLPFAPSVFTTLIQRAQTQHSPTAIRGLASLLSRSPTPLLPEEDAAATFQLLTHLLIHPPPPEQAPEDLQPSVLSSLASLSNCPHRASYLRLLLTHTLPALMGALDAALGDTQAPEASSPASKAMVDRCLHALAHLSCQQLEVFSVVVPSLLSRLLPPSNSSPTAPPAPPSRPLLSTLSSILTHLPRPLRAALPPLLGLPTSPDQPPRPPGSAAEAEPLLWRLLLLLLHPAHQQREEGPTSADNARPLLDEAAAIFYAVTDRLSGQQQDLFVSRVLQLFQPSHLPPHPSPFPSPPSFAPLDSPDFQQQGRWSLPLLVVVLSALHIDSTLLAQEEQAPGSGTPLPPLLPSLLPSLFALAQSDTSPPDIVLAAQQGVAVLLNKLQSPASVEASMGPFLSRLHTSISSIEAPHDATQGDPQLAAALRDVTSLLWLTKAVVLRCGPPSSLAQCTRLLMHIASCSHTPLDGATPPAQADGLAPSSRRVTLALHAAEGFGVIMGHQHDTTHGCPLLSPSRPSSARVNPLWPQRLFYHAFRPLRDAADAHAAAMQPQARTASLLALCHVVAGLPQSILHAELNSLVPVVIKSLGAASSPPPVNLSLLVCALKTLHTIVKELSQLDQVVPHLSTLLPLLLGVNDPTSPLYVPRAPVRMLALHCLSQLASLPYAKLHPYKAMVTSGLLAPLDDRKRCVRQCAVKVRNQWMVLIDTGH